MTGNVDVYAYFNNDVGGTRRATLRRFVEEKQ
jgi:hypothetical protein